MSRFGCGCDAVNRVALLTVCPCSVCALFIKMHDVLAVATVCVWVRWYM